jgi:hypothetical protein
MPITDANGATISPLGGWRILSDSTARKTINLTAAPRAVRKISIEDTVGDASSNNITINANGSELIDGSSSLTISTDNQRVVLESTGTGWTVVSTAVSGLNTDDSLNLTCDSLEMRGAFSLPTVDGSAGQVLKTDGNGTLSWQNDATGSGGGGDASIVQTLNTITGATGDVTHNCTNSHVFYHSSISANFTPNFTEITISNGETTEATLILDQGATGYRPTALKVNSTGSTLHWEGSAAPTASTNAVDMVEMRILKQSNAFTTIAKYSKHEVEIAAPGAGITIPSDALVFLDASDANSYGGSGATWTDLSDEGNDATIYGSPTYNGTDKLFEMAGGDYMSLGSGFADFSSGATFFFIADFGTADRNWERIFDFSVGGASNHAINVGRSSTSTNLNLQVYSPAGYSVNNWYQVNSNQISNSTLACYAITIDGTNAKYYKNGTLADTQSFVYLPSNTTRTQNYIGRSRAGTNEDLTGKMAVFAIFSRDLTASEISDLFDAYDAIYSF